MKTGFARFLAVMLTQVLTMSTAVAAINRTLPPVKQKLSITRISFDFSRGFDIALIKPVESLRTTKQEDISKIIPPDMQATSDGTIVATQILDHSLSNWFNSEAVRSSSLGRTAHQIEKQMEGNVAFGGGEPESIRHSLKFSMRATQTRADVEYTGLTNAQVTYYVVQERTNIEIREPMKILGTQLVYNNIISKEDRTQMVSLRWKW